MSINFEPMPSGLTGGELFGWLSAVTGLPDEEIGAVAVVIGLANGRSVAVIPVHDADTGLPDFDVTITLLAGGIAHAVRSKPGNH
jgi:hypothetical protein